MPVDRILDRLTRVAEDAHLAQSNFRIPYDRDDERYEYIEQGHMFFYPSEKSGWEQIVRHDGMPGEPTSPCFYVWRRALIRVNILSEAPGIWEATNAPSDSPRNT